MQSFLPPVADSKQSGKFSPSHTAALIPSYIVLKTLKNFEYTYFILNLYNNAFLCKTFKTFIKSVYKALYSIKLLIL